MIPLLILTGLIAGLLAIAIITTSVQTYTNIQQQEVLPDEYYEA